RGFSPRGKPYARCTPPNPCSAPTICPAHCAICSSRSVPSSDCNRARSRIEYLPAPIDPPRKISTGLNSRSAPNRSPITARCIAAHEREIPLHRRILPQRRILHHPQPASTQQFQINLRQKNILPQLPLGLHLFRNLSELRYHRPIHQYSGRSSLMKISRRFPIETHLAVCKRLQQILHVSFE